MGHELSGLFKRIAEQTMEYAGALRVPGTVAVGMAKIGEDGLIEIEARQLASKLVRTELRDSADSGSNYAAVAFAKMMRRARLELEIDPYPGVRRGEVDFRGDAALKVGGRVYLVTFSGHPTQEVDNKLATDGLLALWLALSDASAINPTFQVG